MKKNEASPVLSFKDVSFAYEPHTPVVLHHVSFELAKGSFTVIVGPSGGGKSTVLRLAAGLERPTSGTVANAMRTRMVFQSGALLPWATALENVCTGFTGLKVSAREEKKIALDALEALGIRELAGAYPRALSGGQRQRVGIARAMVSKPQLLLLDEPFSALDVETSAHLAESLLSIHEREGITMLMVSHSVEDAVMLADTVLVSSGGTVQKGIQISLPRPRAREDAKVQALVEKIRGLIPSTS